MKLYIIEWIDTNYDECTPAIYVAASPKEAEDRFIEEHSKYFWTYELSELNEVDGYKIQVIS